MTKLHLQKKEQGLVFCLAFSHRPVSVQALCQALGRNESETLETLHVLHEAGLLRRNESVDLWMACGNGVRSRLKEIAETLPLAEGDLLGKGLSLIHSGKTLEGCTLLYAGMNTLLKKDMTLGALIYIDILLNSLKNVNISEHTVEECERYVNIVRNILNIFLRIIKNKIHVLYLIDTISSACNCRADNISVTELQLAKICLQYLFSQDDQRYKLQTSCRDVKDAVHAIKDLYEENPSIQGSSAYAKEEKHMKHGAEVGNQSNIVYYGDAMQKVLEQADKAALTSAAILLLGETGVGKEELARRIHQNSGRHGPFVVVNLASVPEPLFESELFGHEKGAFTGAMQQKNGLLEMADKGTLFIDEVGEIPIALQVKLLRVLQDKNFARVGGTRLLKSDFRLISATNQDLLEKIRDATFRKDLFYRISVVPLTILPLRERPEDIRHMAQIFHAQYAAAYKRDVPLLTREELNALCSRPWQGNVRELKSFIERGVILHDGQKSSPFLHESFWKMRREQRNDVGSSKEDALKKNETPTTLWDSLPTMKEMQRRYIRHVLTLTRGKVRGESGALAILDMKQSSFYKKLKEYGLDKTSQIYGRKNS